MKKKYIIPVAKVIAVEYLLMSGSAVKGPEVAARTILEAKILHPVATVMVTIGTMRMSKRATCSCPMSSLLIIDELPVHSP